MSALDMDRAAFRSPNISKRGSFPSTSLSYLHIADALHRSPDNGATLDLAKKNLTDVGETGVHELATIGREEAEDESSVLRIALGSNRLATLPMAFALLSRLRYLNLKNNSFSVFPEVLTVMPSLDTLDISHNKIKRLPSDPGSLVNLRVFCLSRNKVAKLPSYLWKFQHLNILKVDRNPIEWPPKAVMDSASNLDNPQAMRSWIRTLQRWMEDDVSRTKIHDDSGFSEQQELESNIEDSYNSWSRFPVNNSEFDAGVTPHARSFSIDSSFSISSIAESLQEMETPVSVSTFAQPERPPPLHLGILQSYSAGTSPARSPESYLPSPAESSYSIDENDTAVNGTPVHDTNTNLQQLHARNASYAGGGRSTSRADLLGKKSMPDLRTAKLNFGKKIPDLPDRASPVASSSKHHHDDFSIPSPLSQRQDSGSSLGSNSRVVKPFTRDSAHPSPTRPVPSMAFERNSYFRRLSTLPTATISNTLPKPLLCLIDSARSILFAVCQVYLTLEHYTIHAIDERLSNVLRKVLDPASADMMQLINALDRFDAMSRKTLPPPAVCRSVVESCKDTVAVFGKAVGVLALQLKVLAVGEDVRYLRSMLLVLYGATGEISCAWQAMAPYIEAIRPLLHAKPFPSQSPTGHLPGFGNSEPQPVSAPPTMVPFHSEIPPPLSMLRSHSANGIGGPSVGVNGIRTARRHAGSFSSKDVELGKTLPSYDDMPNMSGGVISGVATYTPTLRAPKRHPTTPISLTSVTISSPSPTNTQPFTSISALSLPLTEGSRSNHSRQGSQASLQASSSSSSPSAPTKTTFLDLPSNSKTQVDKEALHAVQEAVEVAPAVWDMMDEILSDVLETNADVRESLERARAVTKRLSEIIRAMKEGDPAADRKVLREDAHVFLKTVVQLSNVVKTYGGAHAVSSALRSNMVKLTNSTEEFAILLHVSSFSPSPTPRPYSPMLSGSSVQANLLGPPDENRLGSSLSRSRSAQPSASLKLPLPTSQDAPRSALPTQSFKVPIIRRFRGWDSRVDVPESPG